uniref:Dual specificity protein phosphatase n=1 Tax=Pseudonaja textilis TaxID=8673 RepID=A0A670ZSU5_PSETE
MGLFLASWEPGEAVFDLLEPRGNPLDYQTPELGELQRLLWTPVPCRGNVNEVWPNLYIGDLHFITQLDIIISLRRMGITHIVNAAAGRFHIDTGAKFYRDLPVDYYGVEADDDPKFDLSIYFYPTAKYIRAALNSPRGKQILVHCAMGISRSATLVLAFLMIYENKNLVEALKLVREHRGVCPNTGFLSQLRELDLRCVLFGLQMGESRHRKES